MTRTPSAGEGKLPKQLETRWVKRADQAYALREADGVADEV
jgi:hypothetical protein